MSTTKKESSQHAQRIRPALRGKRERVQRVLGKLSPIAGVSGDENRVREALIEIVSPHVDRCRVDALGNLITVKQGEPDAPSVMLAAHMDEVGLMITGIKDSGLLQFETIGGIDPRVLLTKRVRIGENGVPGVIGAKPIHLQEPDERKKPMKLKQLTIDIGASSSDEAKEQVSTGDYVSFDTAFAPFGQERVKGKAFDDRAGCTVLAEVLRGRYDGTVYGVFTAQEEVGLRGAGVAAFGLRPDFGVVLEGTTCADIPGSAEHAQATVLGAGPAITFMDRTTITDKTMVSRLIELAEEHDIPWQWRRTTMGGNDAGALHLTREGVPAVSVNVPSRYIHAPVSVLDLNDLTHAAQLVEHFIAELGRVEP